MKNLSLRPLFIFEMANNHMGSVEHGLRIVDAMHEASQRFPFQLRRQAAIPRSSTPSSIPITRDRFDLKFVKRFSETRLSWDEYKPIKDAIDERRLARHLHAVG